MMCTSLHSVMFCCCVCIEQRIGQCMAGAQLQRLFSKIAIIIIPKQN